MPVTYSQKFSFSNEKPELEIIFCFTVTVSPSSLTPQSCKRPSIVLTRASLEREGARWGDTASSMGSRLPSHLSLGSSSLATTPAPTSPLSLFLEDKDQAWPANRSVTPVLFPEHQLRVPKIRKQSSTASTSSVGSLCVWMGFMEFIGFITFILYSFIFLENSCTMNADRAHCNTNIVEGR